MKKLVNESLNSFLNEAWESKLHKGLEHRLTPKWEQENFVDIIRLIVSEIDRAEDEHDRETWIRRGLEKFWKVVDNNPTIMQDNKVEVDMFFEYLEAEGIDVDKYS